MNNFFTRREALDVLLSSSFVAVTGRARDRMQADFQPVRRQLLQAVADGAATGVAVAVVQDGRIVWEEGFGWANREAGLKATSRTPFNLASITKPFTATTLLTLVAEGKVGLDDPANKYLPKSLIQGTNGNADALTVRLLAAHASGLPTMFEEYSEQESQLALRPAALLREYGRLAYPPRLCYEYSNIAFAALGAIGSNISGADIGTLMTQKVLTPLGLHDSFFDTDVERLKSGAALYDPDGRAIAYYTTSTPASGELYASAHDLAKFAIFNMKTHASGESQILSDEWIDELHKPVFTGPNGISTTFGLFSTQLQSGVRVLFKNGGDPGVATILYMIPSKNLACLVLTNRSDGRPLALRVCNQVLGSYLQDWREPQESCDAAPVPFVVTREFAGMWQGTLKNGGANMHVVLHIRSSDLASLALGDKPAEKITAMQSEGDAFTGMSTGAIDSADAIRAGAKVLKIKLIPHEGLLVGRVLATAGDPNFKNVTLPYVVTLRRMV